MAHGGRAAVECLSRSAQQTAVSTVRHVRPGVDTCFRFSDVFLVEFVIGIVLLELVLHKTVYSFVGVWSCMELRF